MGLLTEAQLRLRLKGISLDSVSEYRVDYGTIVAPAAREFLAERGITLVYKEKAAAVSPCAHPYPTSREPTNTPSGAHDGQKPEDMTALRGATLVSKDHPVILFRGKVDSLQAQILQAQLAFQKLGMELAVRDLECALKCAREVMRCEVQGCDMEETPMLGMGYDEIRARSHDPQKYYGIGHFIPGLEHGEGVILLNSLRTQVREVELCAYGAFKDESGLPRRPGILRALNRLSSLFYVMMFKFLAKEY